MHGEGGLALVTTGAWFVVYSIPRVGGGGVRRNVVGCVGVVGGGEVKGRGIER
jgi:hypothetical protein